MAVLIIIADLPANFDRQAVDIADIQRADTTASFAHCLERVRNIVPQRIDSACARDDNTLHPC